MVRSIIVVGVAAAMLAGCSGEAEKPAEERAQTLQAGEYEVAVKVDDLRSMDEGTPVIEAKAGDTQTQRVCIAADGKIDPALFTQATDSCKSQTDYVKRGRINIQYQCTRPGKGPLSEVVEGRFTKDGFEARSTSATYFTGNGDYELARSYAGRRVGECSAAPAPAAG
jgi:hypothetical protein